MLRVLSLWVWFAVVKSPAKAQSRRSAIPEPAGFGHPTLSSPEIRIGSIVIILAVVLGVIEKVLILLIVHIDLSFVLNGSHDGALCNKYHPGGSSIIAASPSQASGFHVMLFGVFECAPLLKRV